MSKLKDFFNKITGSDRIYTREDLGEMSPTEYSSLEEAVNYQLKETGIPTNSDMALSEDVIYVKGYTRSDGTKVKAHYRSKHGSLRNTVEAVTGAASNLDEFTSDIKGAKELNPFVNVNNIVNKDRPDTKNLANIFLKHPENIQDNGEYAYIQKGFAQNVNKAFNLTGNKKIDDNWEGVVFNENSSLAKNVSSSKELQNQVMAQYDHKTGKFNSDKIGVNFTKDSNLHLSIGHGTILNPKVDSNGYFTGILYDKYDFDLIYKNYDFNVMANDVFWALQSTPYGKNYYTLTPIRFKIEKF